MATGLTISKAGLITRQKAARKLEMSLDTLNELVKRGELPKPVTRGKRWVRFRAADIDAYIERLAKEASAVNDPPCPVSDG